MEKVIYGRYHLKKEDFDKDNTVKEMFEFENNIGLYNNDLYENFKYKADSIVFEVKEIIQDVLDLEVILLSVVASLQKV